MMKYKKIISVLVLVAMVFSMAGCNSSTDTNSTEQTTNEPAVTETETEAEASEPEVVPLAEKRLIKVGTWFDHYYTSDHSDIYDNANVSNVETAQMNLDNMREIEQKYNIELRFVNLTWDGIRESINTSIMAGTPDCDIYECDLQFGIPAALSGYATPIENYAAKDSDIFTEQEVMKYLNLMDQPSSYLFSPSSVNLAVYPLGFNKTMIEEAGLENPQDLWDRGEWTWDKWREYLVKLTVDKDNDSVTDVFGFGGYWTNTLNQMLLANGTHIAGEPNEGLSSPATVEVLDFFYKIYNVDKTARPWDESDWAINNSSYADGLTAFFVCADWLFSEQGGADLPFEIGVVPWPTGPSGNKDSNAQTQISGNWYFIPKGVEDPELLYNVMYDWTNWFKGDTTLRDDTEWSENMYMTERNFEYAKFMGSKGAFDIWGALGVEFSMIEIMRGEKTAAQYAEENKLIIQDALDAYFGN